MAIKTESIKAAGTNKPVGNDEAKIKLLEKEIVGSITQALIKQTIDVHIKDGVKNDSIHVKLKGNVVEFTGTVESHVSAGSISTIFGRWGKNYSKIFDGLVKKYGKVVKKYRELEPRYALNVEDNHSKPCDEEYSAGIFNSLEDVEESDLSELTDLRELGF